MLRVLHVSAECAPLAKAGGLADVVGALPRFTRGLAEGSVIMPAYRWLDDLLGDVACRSSVRIDGVPLQVRVHRVPAGFADFPVYLVESAYFGGDAIYTGAHELEKAVMLSAGALALAEGRFDILHVHDHH